MASKQAKKDLEFLLKTRNPLKGCVSLPDFRMKEPHFDWHDPRGPEFEGNYQDLDENGDYKK